MTEKTTEVSQINVSSETKGLGDATVPTPNAPFGREIQQGLNEAADVKTEQVTKETVTPK